MEKVSSISMLHMELKILTTEEETILRIKTTKTMMDLYLINA